MVLVAAAVAVPLVTLLPWLAHEPAAVVEALRYTGVPGVGGLTFAVQPGVPGLRADPNAAMRLLVEQRQIASLVLLAGLVIMMIRARPPVINAAVLLMLGIYAFSTGFFFQYLVWGLPFLLMAGHVRAVAGIQAVALIPTVLFYRAPWTSNAAVIVYATLMIALWGGFIIALIELGRRELAPPSR
jgi:hypothetical protein